MTPEQQRIPTAKSNNHKPMAAMNTPSPENDQPTYAMLADVRDRALLAERERDEAREDAEKAKAYKKVLKTTNANLKSERDRLADLVKQFIKILDITEESDSGRLFHPTNITSC